MERRRHESGIFVLRPDGPSLDKESSGDLKVALAEQIAAGDMELCVDLDEIESMDSAGIGVLVSAIRQLRGRGEIRLWRVTDRVRDLLIMTQMTRMLRIVDSLEASDPPEPE